MPRILFVLAAAWVPAIAATLALSAAASGQTVWSGFGFTFTKPNGTDPLLPAYQDRITANVWVTRSQFGMGLLNAKTECDEINGCAYTHNFSPDDTEWATGRMAANSGETIAATNWRQLTFTNWEAAYGNQVGVNILVYPAVVHLLSDDIYLDLKFTSWTAQGGGGFSYQRSTASTAPPTGDYDGNGFVDAADYVIWRETLNQTGVPLGAGADGNRSGTIDEGDYTYWRNRFGNEVSMSATGSGSAAAVPEPRAAILLLIGVLPLAKSARCRRL